MEEPELALVFVNYDSARWLRTALATAKQATGNLNVELVVVDNFSPGEKEREWLREVGAEFGARILLLGKNLGYGAAANRGVAHTRAELVAVCNPDVRFTARSLSRLTEFIRSQPDAGVVSPQLYYPDGTPQPSCRRLPRLRYLFWGRRSPFVRMFPRQAPAREFLYLDVWQSTQPVEVEAVSEDEARRLVEEGEVGVEPDGWEGVEVGFVDPVDPEREGPPPPEQVVFPFAEEGGGDASGGEV